MTKTTAGKRGRPQGPAKTKLGQVLRELRGDRSCGQVAPLYGVSVTQVQFYEAGDVVPRVPVLLRFMLAERLSEERVAEVLVAAGYQQAELLAVLFAAVAMLSEPQARVLIAHALAMRAQAGRRLPRAARQPVRQKVRPAAVGK